MTRWTHRELLSPWRELLLVCFVAFGSVTCSSSAAVKIRDHMPSYSHESRPGPMEEATLAFEKGDYARAAAMFETLSEDARDETVSRRALFGLAASRLMLAQTPDEYADAMNVWECWNGRAPLNADGEDARMMTPFLERITSHMVSDSQSARAKAPPPPKDGNPNNNIALYKNLLQSKEKEIELMKSKLDTREKEIRRLRHQINSLEEIHLKFQERKQEVSTP